MSALNKPKASDQPSIKYRGNQNANIYYKVADLVHQDCSPAPFDNNVKRYSKGTVHESAEILSTTQLICRVSQMWDVARRPLSFFHPKSSWNQDEEGYQNELIFGNLAEKSTSRVATSSEREKDYADRGNASHFPNLVKSNLNLFSVSQKISALEPFSEKCIHSSFRNVLLSAKGISSVELSNDLGKIYECIGKLYYPTRVKDSASCIVGDSFPEVKVATSSEACISEETNNSTSEITEVTTDLKRSNLSSLLDLENLEGRKTFKLSLDSAYFLNYVQDSETDGSINLIGTSSIYAAYFLNPLPSCHDPFEKFECEGDGNELPESKERQAKNFIIEDKCKTETFSSSPESCHNTLAKQEHAFAGALAGTCVSLCLHPVDTIKTVVQSCQAEQRSISYIGKSIISDRGLFGLYRGIATNIASSAPISAVYTFTYESVKGVLLPLFPREYYSFAHCVAGGCASVATSFIFTPSERIKQQMQVGTNYHNSWNALIEIVRKGGFSSLYTGWGAVLCRNIPHSIIKFYTYESLKELMIPLEQSNARPSTLQTLLCGGVAGSTAALFTTPFDVVKTRLQTQIPGSKSQYHNVIHALKKIGKNEGLKGLYRGLTPRLVMYMSQGAIFFASYEFFRRFFSVDAPQFGVNTRQKMKEEST